jgi:hypothetical protein
MAHNESQREHRAMTHASDSADLPHEIFISIARTVSRVDTMCQTLAHDLLQIVHLRPNLEIHCPISEGIGGELLVCNEKRVCCCVDLGDFSWGEKPSAHVCKMDKLGQAPSTRSSQLPMF